MEDPKYPFANVLGEVPVWKVFWRLALCSLFLLVSAWALAVTVLSQF
jgi:hypothetical protein